MAKIGSAGICTLRSMRDRKLASDRVHLDMPWRLEQSGLEWRGQFTLSRQLTARVERPHRGFKRSAQRPLSAILAG